MFNHFQHSTTETSLFTSQFNVIRLQMDKKRICNYNLIYLSFHDLSLSECKIISTHSCPRNFAPSPLCSNMVADGCP